MNYILESIKKLLGLSFEDESFDTDIILHINSVFMILTQIGVGPAEGYFITGDTNLWSEFIPEGARLEAVKSYVYLKVKTLFDPPLSSAVAESMNRMISEFEWRLSVAVDPAPVVIEGEVRA